MPPVLVGSRFQHGDIVGLGLDLARRELFVTQNGALLGALSAPRVCESLLLGLLPRALRP